MDNLPSRRRALGLALVVSLVVAGCSSSGGDSTSPKDTAASESSTTAAKDASTTTVSSTDHPIEGFTRALDDFDAAVEQPVADRVAAQKAGDLEAAKAAIAEQRTAYFDFDAALRKLDASAADAESVNELLLVDGDVIANLDEYADITAGGQYEDIVYKEVASVNHWRSVVAALSKDWGGHRSLTPLSYPDGYVGAGDTIHSSSKTPGSYSFEVPDGFAGAQDDTTIDLRGPKGVFISTGTTNASSEDDRPTEDELEAYATSYADAVVSKAGGEVVGSVERADAGGAAAYAFTTKDPDFVTREVLVLGPDGAVVGVSLVADSQDAFDRWLPAFEQLITTFRYAS